MSGVNVQKSKWWAGLAVAASMVAFTACSAPAEDESEPDQSAQTTPAEDPGGQSQGQGAQPNLEGIPEVVAVVNGTEITKDDFVPLFETQFQQMSMQSQQTGQQVDQEQLKTQTAENMVSTELLGQEAASRGIEISDEEVDKALRETAESSQMSPKDFMAAMKEQGLDAKAVDAQLEQQLEIEGLIADVYGEFEVSGEEIGIAYQEAKTQQEQMGAQSGQGGQMPPLEDVRPQLEEQVKSQKETEATQKYAGELRKDAEVTINL